MRCAVQCHKELEIEKIFDNGFSYCEIKLGENQNIEAGLCGRISGIVISLKGMTMENLGEAVKQALNVNAEYVCIETLGEDDLDALVTAVSCNAELIRAAHIDIVIENSASLIDGVYVHNLLSGCRNLLAVTDGLNFIVGTDCFGVCFNVGYANLLQCNITEYVKELGTALKVVHINDNDCRSNQKQMPYTFTYGRGIKLTEWNKIIGKLMSLQYKGWLVFDNSGTFEKAPKELHEDMLKLMKAICEEWNFYDTLEEKLSTPDKDIILFGAGKMAENYMSVWGKKYPPAFLVDNNKDIWGKTAFGVPVEGPEKIIEVPVERRNVLICNMHYREIGAQLERMGVQYECYNDEYFM